MGEKRFSFLYPLLFAIILAFGIFLGTVISSSVNSKPSIFKKDARYNRIEEIKQYIGLRYVDSINVDSIVDAMVYEYLNEPESVEELFKHLDPHSSYIRKEDLQSFNEDLEGNFDGVGIEFNIINDTILVVAALSGGPSEKAGVMPGDKMIFIDDSLVAGKSITNEQVIKKLRGKKGTPVNIKVFRKGEKDLLSYKIIRDVIPVNSLDVAYMVDDKIGYLKLNKFSKDTPAEFEQGMQKLLSKGMQKLILDLRGNPGGYLTGAVTIADDFLPGKKLIVYTQGRAVGRSDYEARQIGMFEKGDLVVLMNEGSASASEILAGALQDNNRATIIGRTSFGKGLVQEVYSLPDSSAVRLTIARYYTPNGKSIQRSYEKGVDAYYEQYAELLMNSGELPDSLKDKIDMSWGIHPDVYVVPDTSERIKLFNQLFNRGYIQQFSYGYYASNRGQFSDYTDLQTYRDKFFVDDAMFREFINFANSRDKEFKVDLNKINGSRKKIDAAIKAFIARQKWGNEGFYPLFNEMDNDFKAAVQELNEFDKP